MHGNTGVFTGGSVFCRLCFVYSEHENLPLFTVFVHYNYNISEGLLQQ